MQKQIGQHRHERPFTRIEIKRFEKYLEESGYKARFETLEQQVTEILTKLNGDKAES